MFLVTYISQGVIYLFFA